jgi:hypothetical protein
MRKSERLRLLELEMLRLQFELEVTQSMIRTILDSKELKAPDMDAGKWYQARLNGKKP